MKYGIYFLLVLTGCNTTFSSMSYTFGTDHLKRGNYDQAISNLEQAVELDPTMARNYSNLAAAYAAVGQNEKAWIAVRKAARCPYDDGLSKPNFRAFYDAYVTNRGLDSPGTDRLLIGDMLGTPDSIFRGDPSLGIRYIYGTCVMIFHEDKLTEVILL